ncbi:MAG: ZIP family metal transporter [Holophagaceae bacterium]|nr:ZIP family metal transporter [Holophagaceae bacterium]
MLLFLRDPAYLMILIACLATLLGGWLVVRFLQNRASIMRYISGMAAGYLVSATVVRIMPEALHFGGEKMVFWILGGFLIVHVIEHGITPHFHYGEELVEHEGSPTTGIIALLGLSMHSFLDGMSITAAMHAQSALGIIVFVGVLLHRIPEGATISSIFLVRGFGPRAALYAAGTLAIAALLGAFLQDILRIPVGSVLAISAGLALYVASADLLPQAQKERGWKSTVSLLAGFLLFIATNFALPHEHHQIRYGNRPTATGQDQDDHGGHGHIHTNEEPHFQHH